MVIREDEIRDVLKSLLRQHIEINAKVEEGQAEISISWVETVNSLGKKCRVETVLDKTIIELPTYYNGPPQ